MYCTYCGTPVSDDDHFCPNCGRIIRHDKEKTKNVPLQVNWINLVNNFVCNTGEKKNAAFEALYKASYRPLFAYVQKYTQNTQSSEDAVQNAFIICYDKIDQLENANNFLPWMKQIAYNDFLQTLRKSSKEVALAPLTDDNGDETDTVDQLEDETMLLPEDAYANEELQRLLLESINNLSETQRIIIKGYYFDEKSINKLSEELGIPVNTVKTNLSRGRKNLEKKAKSYANAYGLKLIPLALVPFLAILAKKDALACEAAVTGGAFVLDTVEKTIGIHAAAGTMVTTSPAEAAASASGSSVASAGTGISTSGTGTSLGSAVIGNTAFETAHAAGSSIAVKIGIGITVAAVASGGTGAYVYNRSKNTSSIVESSEHSDNKEADITSSFSSDESDQNYSSDDESDPDINNTTSASSTDELLESTLENEIIPKYSTVTYTDMTSPYWISRGDHISSPEIRTSNYSGDEGIYAVFLKDLDHDSENELLIFYKQETNLTNVTDIGNAESFHQWEYAFKVYDVVNGIVEESNEQIILTIGENSSNGQFYLMNTYGLNIYIKSLPDYEEILCLDYYSNEPNASGVGEGFTAYRYDHSELHAVASYSFEGSDLYPEQEWIDQTKKMGLNASANEMQELLDYNNDMINGIEHEIDYDAISSFKGRTDFPDQEDYYWNIISDRESEITNIFKIYTSSNIDMNAWLDYTMSRTNYSEEGGKAYYDVTFPASDYMSTLHTYYYDSSNTQERDTNFLYKTNTGENPEGDTGKAPTEGKSYEESLLREYANDNFGNDQYYVILDFQDYDLLILANQVFATSPGSISVTCFGVTSEGKVQECGKIDTAGPRYLVEANASVISIFLGYGAADFDYLEYRYDRNTGRLYVSKEETGQEGIDAYNNTDLSVIDFGNPQETFEN